MKKKIMAFYDSESDYTEDMADYLKKQEGFPYELHTYTEQEKLLSFGKEEPIEVLVVAESDYTYEVAGLPVGKTLLLNESGTIAGENIRNINKYQKAENAGISFQVKFNLGETDTISAFDIGIILNNLLDNAIEACEKLEQEQRYINLTLKKKNHFLLIEVENSFDGKVIWEDGGIVPMTTKQSDLPDILMEHGIGLKNVKNVADHYLGDMDIKIKNDVFKVIVMLQQKEIK